MNKTILILTLLFATAHHYFSQDNECKTTDRVNYPEILNKNHTSNRNNTWNVPVIFHILYRTDTENIHDSLVLGILETLHLDFLGQNTDISSVPDEFKSLIGIPNVNFILATRLPNGDSTTGIIRKKTDRKIFKLNKRDMFDESSIINSKSYLNVYICNTNTNAFTPTENNEKHDGIIIDYTKVFKGSRTLTHEVGHWFDLRHIFGSGNCRSSDGISDTKPQKKHLHFCPKYPKIECGASIMFMNFMDYSTCRYFFTFGQVEKMRTYILNFKKFD